MLSLLHYLYTYLSKYIIRILFAAASGKCIHLMHLITARSGKCIQLNLLADPAAWKCVRLLTHV